MWIPAWEKWRRSSRHTVTSSATLGALITSCSTRSWGSTLQRDMTCWEILCPRFVTLFSLSSLTPGAGIPWLPLVQWWVPSILGKHLNCNAFVNVNSNAFDSCLCVCVCVCNFSHVNEKQLPRIHNHYKIKVHVVSMETWDKESSRFDSYVGYKGIED